MNGRILLVTISLLALGSCTQEETPSAPIRPVLSLVIEPQAGIATNFTGTVEPRYSRDLGFRILGRIVARGVDVGQSVQAGQVVASLDPTSLGLAVRSLQGEIAQAQAQLTNAEATERRQEALVAQNVSSQAELDSAEQARASAFAAVTRAQASLDKAREQLSYTQLVSETDGVVTAVGAEVGQTVTAGQTVVTVAQADIREVVVDMPDAIAQTVAEGDLFEAMLQIDPRVRARGTVRVVAPEADAATRTRRVTITLEEPPATFRLGTTVTAAPTAKELSSIDIPASALGEADGRTFVWVVDEKALTVSRRPVETDGETGETFRVRSGIDVGMRIVTAGVNTLTEGQSVRIDQEMIP